MSIYHPEIDVIKTEAKEINNGPESFKEFRFKFMSSMLAGQLFDSSYDDLDQIKKRAVYIMAGVLVDE
jgi:hypothetical protein